MVDSVFEDDGSDYVPEVATVCFPILISQCLSVGDFVVADGLDQIRSRKRKHRSRLPANEAPRS